MRHGDKINNLSRTTAHRDALLKNLATALITHKRIFTTLAKAKELRKYVEPLLTKTKNDTVHSRRTIFSYLNNKEVMKELFAVVAPKVASRPGGYTRILKTGFRAGDNAAMAMIELVDFNTTYAAKGSSADTGKAKTRRSRAKAKKEDNPSDSNE